MLKKICPSCNKEYKCPESESGRRKYCSRECRANGLFHSRVDERFFNAIRVVPETQCWLISGSIVGAGYRTFPARGRSYRAHRWAYERFIGPIPDGMVVRHVCDVPNCVNPAHLLLGSQQENIHDKMKRGRQATGERMGLAKLSDDAVSEIRSYLCSYKSGMYTSLGKKFGVDRAVISRIHSGKAWRHVS